MILTLDDGTHFAGRCFGSNQIVTGEVVFNTGMTGYIETLTDPSYAGQILVTTYPLQGNYGVPGERKPGTLSPPFESDRIQVQGLIVQNYIDHHSHYTSKRSLQQWLMDEKISAVTGIDTRTLTRRLREHGTMKGWIYPESLSLEQAQKQALGIEMNKEVFQRVAPDQAVEYSGNGPNILLIDVGAKDNIVRSLLARGASVNRVPWNTNLKSHAEKADGILIGNGPGDPQNLQPLIQQLREIMQSYQKPIFGICLGNQILALAAGASTYKLPYGHRSVNQPVQDLLSRRCYITSQNHGYAVKDDSLPKEWEPWFINVNDGTNEGIRSLRKPFFSVQFHPEASPGPQDTNFLFDDFLRLVSDTARK